MYLAACSAYNAFSVNRHTPSTPNQRFYSQPYTPPLNLILLQPPPPCFSFMNLPSLGTHNASAFPLNSPSCLPFSGNLLFRVATDSVKRKWFASVITGDLATLQHIFSNYLFDVDEICQKGNTAFLMVCELQNKSIATYLLSIGANKFVRNEDGWTAFHFSCIHGNQAFATWLLGQGLDAQMITRHGRTSFHIACAHGHKAFAEWLLTLGLSKDAVDHEGNNALDLLKVDNASQEVREYLLSIGLPNQGHEAKQSAKAFDF